LISQADVRAATALFDNVVRSIDGDERYGECVASGYLSAFRARIIEQVAVQTVLLRKMGLTNPSVLSVGGWPGVTAICLRHLGCRVSLLDHPSVLKSSLGGALGAMGVDAVPYDIAACATSGGRLPVEGPFDLIECCECMEHWNFNPIPATRAFLGVLRPESGRVYVTLPNAVSLFRRILVLVGRNIYAPMGHFRMQMDAAAQADVSPHWREYTLADACELLDIAGARVDWAWYQFHTRTDKPGVGRAVYDMMQLLVPPVRDHIGIIAGSRT
jgi:SAM-dependent methyltransferase